MKEVVFRPLRRIKKTGKIAVASYMAWNKVMTADYNKFNLIILDDYKQMPQDEFVYDHNGELLYFLDYNPADITIYDSSAERILDEHWLDKIHERKLPHGIKWIEGHINYSMPGADCVGVPIFSHITAEYVSEYYCNPIGGYPEKIFDFNPLTVRTVRKWFGWFLYQLENSNLKIGK
jgi:hypothetical protein